MSTLGNTKDSQMDMESHSEQIHAAEFSSSRGSQGVVSRDGAKESKHHEEIDEDRISSLPPSLEPVPETVQEKATYMRVARKHISAEILDKHFIPYIDDPDPSYLLVTQWLPQVQLESLWMESSNQETATKSESHPSSSLLPIKETDSSSDSPLPPAVPSRQDSASNDQTVRQKAAQISTGYSSSSHYREATPQASFQSSIKEQGNVPKIDDIDQWEDIENKEKARRPPKRKQSHRANKFPRHHEQHQKIAQKLKKLAWEQRSNNDGIFKSFGQLQALLLVHAQHDLVMQLQQFNSQKKSSRERIRNQLHRYIKSLQDYKWTQNFEAVPWQEAENHIKEVDAIFPECESEYSNPYARDNNFLIDVAKRSTIDPVRKALTKLLPRRFTTDNPIQAELLTHMRDLGFTEAELPTQTISSRLFVTYSARLLLALSGGLFLLVPMLIMSRISEQRMRLLVTSLFVIIFSIFLSSLKMVSSLKILGGTAAYSAALVIFVGRSNDNG